MAIQGLRQTTDKNYVETPDDVLDCTGLKCPMPIVRISKALKGKPLGARLVVVASDPAFRADLDAWADARGERVVAFEEVGLNQRAVIEKARQ